MILRPISEWTFYRARFAIAYFLLAVLIITLLAININVVPPGISPSEQTSVISSAAISFTQLPTNIVDIPFHTLQKLSVEWFGLTPLGVRLPALIFGLLTALCTALVLRRWFKTNVAVAAGLIVLTSAWFLSLARLGAPFVMVPFWTSLILLSATYVSQQTKAWKWWRVIFVLAAALSLYTPAMVYLFIAATLASVAQPHLRYLLRGANRVNVFIGSFFFLLLLVPLGWGIYKDAMQIWSLAAVTPNLPDLLQFGSNLWAAASNFLNPANISTGEVITPVIGVASAALLLIGAARLLRDFHSVRAHVLLIWAALLLPVVGLNPSNTAVLFVPAMLVIAIGLNQVIRYWYRLFPLNPYARIFAVVPLAFLVISIVQFNYQRYTFGMLYSPQAASVFDRDPFLAQDQVTKAGADMPVTIVVNEEKHAIYETIRGPSNFDVMDSANLPLDRVGTWIVANAVIPVVAPQIPTPVDSLIVTDSKADGLRFWVYQR